jgi:SAM-dependent methyltransferase
MTSSWNLKLSLFIISLCLLCLEILHIRIFGYTLAPVLSYCAISFAMLGFAGGAAVLSLRPAILKRDAAGTVMRLSVGFAAAVLLSAWLLVFIPSLSHETKTPDFSMKIILLILPSLVPYLLAGLTTAVIFSTLAHVMGQVYFINLLGSALGCILPLLLMRSVGVEALLTLVGIGGLAAALPVSSGMRPSRRAGLALAAAALAAVLLPFSQRIFDFKPDPTDQIAVLGRVMERQGLRPPEAELSSWDPVGRIEVYRVPGSKVRVPEPAEYRIITVDSGASTLLLSPPRQEAWGRELFEDSLYGIGYHVTPESPDVLVIGVGGGVDVHTALHWKARSVTGVEIAATTLDLLTGRYREFAGILSGENNVELVHADGRNFSKHTDRKFDLIQLTGVDTITLTSPGALVLVEDYLYTVEAFRDFLSILKPGGTLVVLRFDSEAINLGLIAYHALKKSPFTPAEIEALRTAAGRTHVNDIYIPHYNMYDVKLGNPITTHYLPTQAYTSLLMKRLQKLGGIANDADPLGETGFIQVPTDDRPYYMAGRMFTWLRQVKAVRSIVLIRNTWITILFLSALFLLLPLLSRRPGHPARLSSAPALGFFLAIAVGFMFIEIGLIQKTIIFIGHPGGSASLVLMALLVGTGIGSWLSSRLGWAPLRILLVLAPVTALVTAAYGLSSAMLFEGLSGLDAAWRWTACCVLIALAGVPMGFMFPTGLRLLAGRYGELVPWAIAVNGFASASASVMALPLGISAGHGALIVTGSCFYLAAMASIALFGRREGLWSRP